MPAIVIEDLSPTALAELERRAAAENRSIEEEVKDVVERAVLGRADRLPMYVPSPEISAPFDLPYPTPGVKVKAKDGGRRWPDPGTLPQSGDEE